MDYRELISKAIKPNLEPCSDPASGHEWARYGFHLAYEIIIRIREVRLDISSIKMIDKPDGSPVSLIERDLELYAIETSQEFYSKTGFIGEESGEVNPEYDIKLIIDPIDGTRSFFSGFDSYSFTISIVGKDQNLFSLVGVPATGDIGYRVGSEKSYVFQFPVIGQSIKEKPHKLPIVNVENIPILVSVHPARDTLPQINRLYKMWEEGKISLVKSVSGSPALQILEAAKGGEIYINSWNNEKSNPYDLVSASNLLRGCNGTITDLNGNDIDPWNHVGLFIAGVDRDKVHFILNSLK